LKMLMKNKKGFTLVELLVVIAIIAILAAVVAPNAFKTIEKSKVTAIEADYRAVKTATLVYYSDIGQWPGTPTTAEDDPGFVVESIHDADDGWNGPYLDVWVANAPIGTNYNFVNRGATVVPATGVIAIADTIQNAATPAADAPTEAIYLRITDLPETAFDRLTTDLGVGQVFSEGTTFPTDVYLLIANK
jgi:general secretion pathway protein G